MREFLFGPAYQKEQVTLTIAGGGTGKTSLCIAEAVAMASGTDFLETPKRPLRVWIYNGEEPLDELDRRVRAAAIAQGLDHAELRKTLFVNSGRGDKRIDLSKSVQNKGTQVNEELVRSLIDSIRDRIDVVIVDPFISTHSISENDNSGIDMMAKAWEGSPSTASAPFTSCTIRPRAVAVTAPTPAGVQARLPRPRAMSATSRRWAQARPRASVSRTKNAKAMSPSV